MFTRTVEGRAQVVREIRAAAPLLAAAAAPTTARGPWLTAALHAPVAGAPVRPRAVIVTDRQGRPAGAALLSFRPALRRGRPVTTIGLLADGVAPGPPGLAPHRLPTTDPDVAGTLADGVAGLLDRTRGPWHLALAGLPLGDPLLAALAARLGVGVAFRTARSRVLVDTLDTAGPVRRSTDPARLERWLPALLEHRPAGARGEVLRALARVHAAAGLLEHAVLLDGGRVVAGLLTLVEGDRRRPWWGFSEVGGLAEAPGEPWVSMSAASRELSR